MKRMPFTLHGKGGSGLVSPPPQSPPPTSPLLSSSSSSSSTSSSSSYHHHHHNTTKQEQQQRESSEPRSVLDQRRSPSPPTSTSTSTSTATTTPCSSSLAATSDVAAAQHPPPWPPSKEDDWELQPLPLVLPDPHIDDPSSLLRWLSSDPLPSPSPSLLPDLDAPPPSSTPTPPPTSNSTFDPSSLLFDLGPPPVSSLPLLPPAQTIPPTTATTFPFHPTNLFFQDPSPPLFFPISPLDPSSTHLLSSPPTKPTTKHPPPPPPPPPLSPPSAPTATGATNQPAVIERQQVIIDQLLKAAEQIESGNPVTAHAILARLNHHLLVPTANPHQGRPPLHRSASYFKDALSSLLSPPSSSPPPLLLTPWDVVLKLSAHKSFSDHSPIPQFVSLTCVQSILEELDASSHRSLHILDFDLGVGGHWSSLLQELSHRRTSTTPSPSLRITAFLSPSSHHPLELVLIQDNLSQFATDLGILFEFNALPVDSFELAAASLSSDEAFAVNLPVASPHTSSPTFIHLLKQLSPRVVVSIDLGCNRNELPFSQHFLHSLHTYTILLNSLDAANAASDAASRVGRFLLQPRIENSLLTRYQGGDNPLPWRALFASAGFTPLQLSNFAETQAECLLKRSPARGFKIERRQSSLALVWQNEELVSVSSWRC